MKYWRSQLFTVVHHLGLLIWSIPSCLLVQSGNCDCFPLVLVFFCGGVLCEHLQCIRHLGLSVYSVLELENFVSIFHSQYLSPLCVGHDRVCMAWCVIWSSFFVQLNIILRLFLVTVSFLLFFYLYNYLLFLL